jgi:16S rRNA processing protein RimM
MDRGDSFTIGRVTGVHGLNGNLKVWSFAHSPDTFSPGRSVLLQSDEGHGNAYTIVQALPHKKGILLTLEGVDTRELAENLKGQEILMDRDQLPEPEAGTWFWQDLLGLDVKDHERGCIGKITDIFPTGANDVLVVTGETGETLVPMHRNFVASVDMEKGILFTTLPPEY